MLAQPIYFLSNLKKQEWTSYLAGNAGGLGGGSGALGFLIIPESRKEVFSIPSMSFESELEGNNWSK